MPSKFLNYASYEFLKITIKQGGKILDSKKLGSVCYMSWKIDFNFRQCYQMLIIVLIQTFLLQKRRNESATLKEEGNKQFKNGGKQMAYDNI